MVSSKLNQWTLLVGTLRLVYSLGLGRLGVLHWDAWQVEEIFLTAAQSMFGIAILFDLRLWLREAVLFAFLFFAQRLLSHPRVRYGLALAYLAMGAAL